MSKKQVFSKSLQSNKDFVDSLKKVQLDKLMKRFDNNEIENMKCVICELIKMHEHPELSNDDWKKAVIDVAKEKGYGNDC